LSASLVVALPSPCRLAKPSVPTSVNSGRCISFSSRGTLSQLSRYILLFSFSSGQLVKWGPRAGVVGELPFIPGPHPPTPTEVVAVHQCFVVKKLGKCQIRSHPHGGWASHHATRRAAHRAKTKWLDNWIGNTPGSPEFRPGGSHPKEVLGSVRVDGRSRGCSATSSPPW
jgi:hypothetical protein